LSGYDAVKNHNIAYWVGYNYSDAHNYDPDPRYNNNSTRHNFSCALNLITPKRHRLNFKTTYSIKEDEFTSRQLQSSLGLSGPLTKGWNYTFANYYTHTDGENQYNTNAGVSTHYSGRGYSINFNAKGGYQYFESISEGNYYLASSIGASKRLTRAMNISLSSGLSIGSQASSYSATAGMGYVFSRRFRFHGYYNYSSTAGRYTQYFVGATSKKEQHRIVASLMGNLGWATMNTNASFTRQISSNTGSRNLSINNILNTRLYRLPMSFSAGYTYSRQDDAPYGSHSLSLGHSFSFSPLYRVYVRVSQNYSRSWTEVSSSYSYSASTGLFWRIRLLFFNVSYAFTYTDTETTTTREHRVFARVTRPFYL
jgi:hypothetical protein